MDLLAKLPVRLHFSRLAWSICRAAFLLALGAGLCYAVVRWAEPIPAEVSPPRTADAPRDSSLVRLAPEKWSAAGIRLEPATYSAFTERVWRSGRLALNETRIAHISPMVEGVVHQVKVRLGQDVQAGEILAVLNSREVGQAKLDLIKSRLAASYARTQHSWTQTTSKAASELVEAMTSGTSVAEIEKRFKDRSIGELRQQLMSAYSRRLQTRTSYEAVSQYEVRGSVPQATVTRLRADHEAAEATFWALCEEVKYQGGQQVRASEQKLREAQTAESLSKATLLMLGYSRDEVEAMDPLAEGAKASLYTLRAPFAGTVIDQHAVLSERVGPQQQMFEISDLRTLWLQADVMQKDLPLVQGLTGGKIRFRVNEEAGTLQEARVFYTGDVVDRTTRAVALSAEVDNPHRAFKPGMFVEVELAHPGSSAVQVPAGAIQRQGTQAFVFAHAGADEFRRVDVKLGRTSGDVVEVLEGLKSGQQVVVAGGFVLKSILLADQIAGD